MKKMTKSIALILIFFCLSAPIFAKRIHAQDNTWLFSIDGKRKTVLDLHNAYSGFLVLLKEQIQQKIGQFIDDAQFDALIDNPEAAPKELASMLQGFSEEAFAAQYEDMELVVAEAKKAGYANRPAVRAKLQALEKYYLANLYIFALLETQTIVPTEEEISVQMAKLKNTESTRGFSEAELRQSAVSQVILEKAQDRQRSVMQKLRSKHLLKKNESADIKQLLDNERRGGSVK